MRCVFNLAVWGAGYVRGFLDYSLPTLFTAGNLRDFPFKDGSVFSLMTTRADWSALSDEPAFRRLASLVEVVPGFIDDFTIDPSRPKYNHKYIRVSMAQRACIQAYGATHDAIFFLYPDFVYSTGALRGVAEKMAEGADAVCVPIPYISEDAVRGGLFAREGLVVDTPEGPLVPIPPWRLVDLQIRNPHPIARGYDMDADVVGEWPGYFVWQAGWAGQLMRCFHLHPMAIRCMPDDPAFHYPFELSLDDEYVSRLLKDGGGIHCPPDTDGYALCSMRWEADPPHPVPGRRSDLLRAARWAETHSSLLQREFLDISYRWRRGPGDEADWARCEARAATFVERLRRRLQVPDSVLEFEDPETFRARSRRPAHFAQTLD